MISSIISRLGILLFGTLYPAYASYKAVRTKNVKEYVKWMMYWIVFALFTCVETFTDVFLGFWFPFYYEIKIVLVLWLLSPATKGSSFLYRKFVHPMLTKREPEIDEYIARAKEQGYTTILQLGSQGMSFATNVIMQTAIKKMPMAAMAAGEEDQQQKQRHVTDGGATGESCDFGRDELMAFSDDDSSVEEWMPSTVKAATASKKAGRPRRGRSASSNKGGGGIVNHLRKSYSLCDLSKEIDMRPDLNRNSRPMGLPEESVDGVRELQTEMRTRSARQKAAAAGTAVAGSHMDLYFPEVDVNIRSHGSRETPISLSQIRSTDDISSGFASSDPVYAGEGGGEGLVRSGSLHATRIRRPREDLGRGRISKRGLTSEDSDEFDLEEAGLELPTLPLSTNSFPSYSSPADQIPYFFNTNMNQLNNQLAFINLLQANQAFMNRFLAHGNVVESMFHGRHNTGVIVDEIVSESNLDDSQVENPNPTTNSDIISKEINATNDILGHKYCSKAENEKCEELAGIKEDKLAPKLSPEQKVEKLEQNFTPDQKINENFEPTNKIEQNVQQITQKTEASVNADLEVPKKISDNLGDKSLEDVSLGSSEVTSPPPRKGRYGKKAAPRPPSVYIANDDQEVENEEDFKDAESEVDGNEFLGKAPDLISELGLETTNQKSSMLHGGIGAPEVNVSQNKSHDNSPETRTKQSDSSSTTPDAVVKTKDKHSKMSKLLPKNSFFNFFHLKEPSRADTKSLRSSSESIQSRNSPARDDSEGIVIPLTDDETSVNDHSEFFESYQDPVNEDRDISQETKGFVIREMSQSPTAKKNFNELMK